MELIGKAVCKVCGKPVEENILAHYGREHAELFRKYPNPLADLAFVEERK